MKTWRAFPGRSAEKCTGDDSIDATEFDRDQPVDTTQTAPLLYSSSESHRSGGCRNTVHHRHPLHNDKEAQRKARTTGRPQKCGRSAFISCRPWLWLESLQGRTRWKRCMFPDKASYLLLTWSRPQHQDWRRHLPPTLQGRKRLLVGQALAERPCERGSGIENSVSLRWCV